MENLHIEDLDSALEALLFVSGEGLSVEEIASMLIVQKSEVRRSIERLQKKYCDESGIHLITYNKKAQLCTNPKYAEILKKALTPIKESRLSNSALEVVAIVAYKQPITRLEIEQIRGVNCDYAIQVLLKFDMIEVVGKKDAIGNPFLFGTTEEFLKRFRLNTLADLPDYENLLESIKVLETPSSGSQASLFKDIDSLPNYAEQGEDEIPEFLEGEENIEKVE
ncbi:MAG: SMC-Scp complex subunit ScpB [Firmicutes bacterium]|nr:SMC-Scp complex subunit ScpB [Bacillota bacterium]MCL2256317.1 SMC-Scp complex subunit ScpB [Bacillota bacterium]